MRLSKWTIPSKGNVCRADSLVLNPEARIILLDDHLLFRDGLISYCIRPFFNNIEVLPFRNGDHAFEYLKEQIRENNYVDLFITDINHPGVRGNELVMKLRVYERQFNRNRQIPILILSMVDETTYPELIDEKMVDAYLTKASEAEVIVDCLEELLYV
jgi:DNA-binding NarL/FixJ family response regulator